LGVIARGVPGRRAKTECRSRSARLPLFVLLTGRHDVNRQDVSSDRPAHFNGRLVY